MLKVLAKIFGDSNRKEIDRYQSLVNEVNELEAQLESLTDQQLKEESLKLKQKVSVACKVIIDEFPQSMDRRERNKILKKKINQLLESEKAYAFSLVREAAKRTIGLRHYDVQIIGGAVLNDGQISEMKTGEGKTLVASLPLYLNALTGMGAHLVTVNDYLARRDAGWMGPIYDFLGLTVGVIAPQFSGVFDRSFANEEVDERLKHLRPTGRKAAYQADITYGTNNEFGFDYLRDNMAQSKEQIVQRELAYAIVDEVDSILIDEARTPLIISAPSSESAMAYTEFARYIPQLKPDIDYAIDEKSRTVSLQQSGIEKLERLIGISNLYDPNNARLVHYADVSLKAYALYKRNKDYVVKDGEIIIVDEFTGRLLHGRRFSAGLHQAIEAKEGVAVKEESVTLATITFQNLFRLYIKLAGMTGTALTEAEEFSKIYNLEVVAIPTHRPSRRLDHADLIFKTEEAKFRAITAFVKNLQEKGQPVLIGTVSIAKSEKLSKLLKAADIKHTVLNAKHHQREGEIIAQAGQIGAVTVATNMAGRGVDIILGGPPPPLSASSKEFKQWRSRHEKVVELGGLFVIGTERHESRRIDNQLRGRAARQGDPGESQFYLSMEDDLMRIFGGDRMKALMEKLRLPDDTSINNKLLTRAIEQAQVKVEAHNFEIRKQLVEYDDVINKHREAIYRRRRAVLNGDDKEVNNLFESLLAEIDSQTAQEIKKRQQDWGEELTFKLIRMVFLRSIDILWVEHLRTMEELRESIGLRGYGQRDPIVEYKQESFRLFEQLQRNINNQVIETLLRLNIEVSKERPISEPSPDPRRRVVLSSSDGSTQATQTAPNGINKKIGRNDPCPCGAVNPNTGKPYKYKHCGLINAPHHQA